MKRTIKRIISISVITSSLFGIGYANNLDIDEIWNFHKSFIVQDNKEKIYPDGLYQAQLIDGYTALYNLDSGKCVQTYDFQVGKDFEEYDIVEIRDNKVIAIWELRMNYDIHDNLYFVSDVIGKGKLSRYAIINIYDRHDIELMSTKVRDLEYRDIVKIKDNGQWELIASRKTFE